MKPKPKDISFHYTNEQMVKDLLALIPAKREDTFLDAGSGKNKVWFNNLHCGQKFECEIEDGCDFLKWDKRIDWVIGNPPFHQGWEFFEKAPEIANKGIAFLINHTMLNSIMLPRRLKKMEDFGFYLQKLHIVQDKRWFGRYYFLIFIKEKSAFISWNTKSY